MSMFTTHRVNIPYKSVICVDAFPYLVNFIATQGEHVDSMRCTL